MRYLAILVVAGLLLPSCTAVKKAEAMLDEGKALIAEARAAYQEIRTEADTNQDGKVSGDEWLTYLLGLLGLGGVGGAGVLVRNAKSNARKDIMEARLESLERKVPV